MARGDASGIFQPEDLGEIRTLEEMSSYLQREFRRLSSALALGWAGHMEPRFVAPPKPRDGDIAFADGVLWNPGSGVGAYIFYAGAWHPFGGGGAGPAGATGGQGPIGFGILGEDGADGMPIPGNPGQQGIQGIPGPVGLGVPGQEGIDGDDGMPIPGNPGLKGDTGATGPQGPLPQQMWITDDDSADVMMVPGNPGQQGIQGIQGVTGAGGPPGPMIAAVGDDSEPVPVGFNARRQQDFKAVQTVAFPATNVAVLNPTGKDCMVYIKGGTTMTQVLVDAASTLVAGTSATNPITVFVGKGQSITVTYTGSPQWNWIPTE